MKGNSVAYPYAVRKQLRWMRFRKAFDAHGEYERNGGVKGVLEAVLMDA